MTRLRVGEPRIVFVTLFPSSGHVRRLTYTPTAGFNWPTEKEGDSVNRIIEVMSRTPNLSQLDTSEVAVVVTMDRREPWGQIFEEGQLPTWVNWSLELGFYVARCESLGSGRIGGFFDQLALVRQHDPIFSPFIKIGIRAAVNLHQRSPSDWSIVDSENLPIILENRPSSSIHFYSRNRAMLEWISGNPQYKWIYRVHSSSYIHPERFFDYVSRLPQDAEIVAGPNQIDSRGRRFLSGSGILWSRKAALKCLSGFHLLKRYLPEDVGLGLLFHELGIQTNHIERVDIASPIECFGNEWDSQIFHFRCKSLFRPAGDVETMNILDHAFRHDATETKHGLTS